MDATSIKTLVQLRDNTFQKARVAMHNRVVAIQDGRDVADQDTLDLFMEWEDRFQELETQAGKDIAKAIGNEPIVETLVQLKGIAFTLAAKLVSQIDITKTETPSALWRYAGYGVTDGQRDRPTKGQKLIYNATLKKDLYLVGSSFMRSASPYRKVYDDSRAYYEQFRPDWTKAHIHLASLRKMIKIFLVHLYEVWRTLEGLPIRDPYVFEKLEHTKKYTAQEMGWPVMEKV